MALMRDYIVEPGAKRLMIPDCLLSARPTLDSH